MSCSSSSSAVGTPHTRAPPAHGHPRVLLLSCVRSQGEAHPFENHPLLWDQSPTSSSRQVPAAVLVLELQQQLLPAQEELQELASLASERNEGWQGGEGPFKLCLCNPPIPFSTDTPRNACAMTGLVSLSQESATGAP